MQERLSRKVQRNVYANVYLSVFKTKCCNTLLILKGYKKIVNSMFVTYIIRNVASKGSKMNRFKIQTERVLF